MRFSAEQAQEASECGEPILISLQDVIGLLQAHTSDVTDIHAPDFPKPVSEGQWDAWAVLMWLGY